MQMETLAGLNCRLVGPNGDDLAPQAVVIFCHGFGAGGDDLVPLAVELQRRGPTLKDAVLFVFPEGPLSLPEIPGGRAWWPIDLEALQRASQTGELRQMRQDCPPLLPEARQKLMGVIDALRQRTGLPLSQFVLGGFSQGSMLATDVALRLDENVGGLVIYSGTLLIEPEWQRLAAARRGLRVLQSHGTIDPLLPFDAAVWLRDLLQSAGAEVEFIPFHGMHTIPQEAVASTTQLIARVVETADAAR